VFQWDFWPLCWPFFQSTFDKHDDNIFRCREDKEHEAKPTSEQMQAEESAQVSQLSGRCLTSSPVPCIWEQLRRDWGRRFYIRLDAQGCLHTYPDVGGPFKSLLETNEAIDRYLEARRDPKM